MYTAAASTEQTRDDHTHPPADHAASHDSILPHHHAASAIYGAVENSRGRDGSDAILIDGYGDGDGDGQQYAPQAQKIKEKKMVDFPTPTVLKNLLKLAKQRPIQAAMASLAFLLLLVALAYQMMVGSVNVWPDGANLQDLAQVQREIVHDLTYITSATFNCSDLGLRDTKHVVEEAHHYHTFDPRASSSSSASCQSKYQQHCFRTNNGEKHQPPTKFLYVLREYEAYHERCTKGVDLTELGMAGEVPEGCKYLVWKAMDGMGNQLLSLVCAFVYSLLTNRVMLIATDSHVDHHICEPFPRSSWLLPDAFPEPKLRMQAKRVFAYLDEALVAASSQNSSACPSGGSWSPMSVSSAELPTLLSLAPAPKHLQVYIVCCDQMRDHQFFCPTAQRLFSAVNWIFYHSHEYTLPGFYFVPEFREKLNDWFPSHDVFMHVSRYLLNPVDHLWGSITKIYKAELDGVPRRVGFQARSWKGDYNPSISAQILRCGIDRKLLPKPLRDQQKPASSEDAPPRRPDISVLVTSLRAEYRDNLHAEYANHPNEDGSEVTVWTASNEGWQKTGDTSHDETAIVDIWLLSFMQELVTTPFSTFGSTASGLAGIVPMLFNWYGENRVNDAACTRTNAGGPCFIVYPRNQPCDLDQARASIFDPFNKVPEVKFCDFNPGLGIVVKT